MKGGRFLLLLSVGFLGFISYGEAVHITQYEMCQRPAFFQHKTFKGGKWGSECKAAIFFACLTDSNKSIFYGATCFDLFVKACKEVNHDARKFFKEHDFKNGLFFNEKNVFAFICNDEPNCAETNMQNLTFLEANGFNEFKEYVKKNGDLSIKYECTVTDNTLPLKEDMTAYDHPDGPNGGKGGPSGDSIGSSGNKLDNAFGLLGMMAIFFGWSFIQQC